MNQQERISGIEHSSLTGELISINYNGDNTPKEVKLIDLKYLVYNPHNGRIKSLTKSYESNNSPLDPENPTDKLTIEQFLYDSAAGKNPKTMESLEEIGQQQVGIVTKDGVIIDGNRRAMLLNLIARKKNQSGFFKAIVLPDNLADNKEEIITLETSYQMGVDSKVDYNPIEKYLRIKELHYEHNFSIEKIAKIMAEEPPQIREWLDRLLLMEEYLDFTNSPFLYTKLAKKEGHFVDLFGNLNSYTKRKHPSVKWEYTNSDIDNLKKVYFSYIRTGVPVADARVIARTTGSNSFFCNPYVWVEFYFDYLKTVEEYDEPTWQELKLKYPEKTDDELGKEMDTVWYDKVGKSLLILLEFYESFLRDLRATYEPVKILKRVLNSLNQIKEDALIQSKDEATHLVDMVENRVIWCKNVVSQ
jgi:hypothetical protein